MNKWIAEFDLEDGDTMPKHMDLNYMGARIDFHCRPLWIPCSEQMPPVGKTVIVTVKTENDIWTDYDTWYQEGWMAYIGNDREVIAWMPLPEPYKEK